MKKIMLFAALALISASAMSQEIKLSCKVSNEEGHELITFDPELNTLLGKKNGEELIDADGKLKRVYYIAPDSLTIAIYGMSSGSWEWAKTYKISRVDGKFSVVYKHLQPEYGKCEVFKPIF